MKHTIQHGLSPDLALRATRKALETYKTHYAQYRPTTEWVTEHRARVAFTILGRTLAGTVEVHEEVIDLVLDIPLLFRPFQDTAMNVVEEEIALWLERARAGDLDA